MCMYVPFVRMFSYTHIYIYICMCMYVYVCSFCEDVFNSLSSISCVAGWLVGWRVGSFSRSAVNYNAGCRTPVSNMVMSAMVLVVLAVATPLFHNTPSCILASIIINAVINLIDVKAAILIWKIDKLDFIACMGAFLGVLFVSVEIGLLIAVILLFNPIVLP